MIKCNCCGKTKYTAEFTHSTGYGWAKHCRECGMWLRLFREAFGPTRDWKANREKTAIRDRERYWAKKRSAGIFLDTVWRNA